MEGITCCYNTGVVTGTEAVGGLCGSLMNFNGSITDSFNLGKVSGSGSASEIVGIGGITNCYYLAPLKTDTLNGITGMTAEQFASGEVAWLLNKEGDISSNKESTGIWAQGAEYPVFADATHQAVKGKISITGAVEKQKHITMKPSTSPPDQTEIIPPTLP